MKTILIVGAAFIFLGSIIYNSRKADTNTESPSIKNIVESETVPANKKSPVLVELFTSEGCSSCPPADKNLMYLDEQQPFAGVEVIVLSMHVDYWNRLGWTDPFSSSQFSDRQGYYSSTFKLGEVYTPQMVVDGRSQFVGGNLDEARKAVGEAVNVPKGNVGLSVIADSRLKIKISDVPKHPLANVFLAVAEDNLSTAVRRGENGGRTLHHTAVVRQLKTLGVVKSEDGGFEIETHVQLQPSWKKRNLKLVVFVQVEQTSQIIGAGQLRL